MMDLARKLWKFAYSKAKAPLVKRIIHIVVSVWLSFLLLFGSTTMSFLHSFTGHEDTVDSRGKHDGLAIEKKHHHCAFLGFVLAPFANDSQLPVIQFQTLIHFSAYHAIYNAVKLQAHHEQLSLRGPPAIA